MSDDSPPRLPDLPHHSADGPPSRRSDSPNTGTFLALFGLGLLAFGLIGIVAQVMPQVGGLILVILGAIGFFAAHYVLWGWWLPRFMSKDETGD